MTGNLRLAVTGGGGRMGRETIAAARDRGHEVTVAVNRTPADPVAGVAVEPADRLSELLTAADPTPDALIDFTGPSSSADYVEACADAGIPAVVGTTGFESGGCERLRAAADAIPVLKAANFARGVQALRRAIREAVAALPRYDVELTETHHNGKQDAPSGTARTLLSDVEAVRDDLDARTYGREGEAPRSASAVGVHARRAGDVTGEHELLIAGNRETLTLTHRAGSRGVFAAGALDAAAWLADREPGWYGFDDVVGGGDGGGEP